MKKLILSVPAVLFAALFVHAQEIPDRQRSESKPVVKEKIVDKKEMANLELSDDQKAKLKSMNHDLHKQMEDLRKQDNITEKEYREKIESLHKDRQAQFQSILTEQQKAQLQKDKDARQAKTKEFGRKKQAKMKEELNLTDEQVGKMAENRKVMAEKMQSIQDDKTLSDEQKKRQTREVMKKQKESMRSILTPEQLQKMRERHKEHPKKKAIS